MTLGMRKRTGRTGVMERDEVEELFWMTAEVLLFLEEEVNVDKIKHHVGLISNKLHDHLELNDNEECS